jgi:predicted nucleotidyltransferase
MNLIKVNGENGGEILKSICPQQQITTACSGRHYAPPLMLSVEAFRLASVGCFVYVLHMSKSSLTRDEAIRRLHTVESEIRRLGVRRLALFGSVLRNEARPDSDVDVLVEFVPREKTFDRFMALADLLEDTLEHRVEVVTTESLSPFIGPHILAEATDVLRAA